MNKNNHSIPTTFLTLQSLHFIPEVLVWNYISAAKSLCTNYMLSRINNRNTLAIFHKHENTLMVHLYKHRMFAYHTSDCIGWYKVKEY